MGVALPPGEPVRDPKYLRLAKGFEREMRAGALRVGDRLPSVRELRQRHHVSVATALGCYTWLEREGLVQARPRSGYYVRRMPAAAGPAPRVVRGSRGPVPVRVVAPDIAGSAGPRGEALSLGPAVVGPAWLPMNRLNRSLRLALSAFTDHAVRYEDPRGNPRLRRQLARLVFRQGGSCSPDDILVTSGETEALSLCVRTLTSPGDVVAVESPGCYAFLQALESYKLRAVEIPHLPGRGIDLGLLETALHRHRVKVALLNVTCHNALGDCASDEGKAEIVAFAARHELPIIEGDVFGDLVFSGERPRTLQSFDRDGLVVLCSSLASHVAPGFNLGWAAGSRFQDDLRRLKAHTNRAGARLPQLALAEFLESGAFDKHLRRLRLALWRSVEAAREQILETFPAGTRVSRPEGGFVLWVELPDEHDGVAVQRRAAAHGIHVLPGSLFSPTGQYAHCIRIACGHPVEVLRPALGTIAGLLREGSTGQRRAAAAG
jgi:DNA-binding transcriptional MocR family regulator